MSAQGGTSAAESLSRAALDFLRRYPPFDAMEEEALGFLAARLAVGYYARGARILEPGRGEPQYLYIVRNGLVQLGAADTYHLPTGAESTLGPGECFPVGALLESRSVASPYVTAADTFCYQLPAGDFRALLDRSPRFREFSTRYLVSLLSESRRLLRMHHASLVTEQQAMGRSLRTMLRRPVVACAPDTAVGAALRAMQENRIGCIVVTDPAGAPAGILTRHDVLDRITLAGRGLHEPIAEVMTRAPATLPAEASAYDAALLIARLGIRHVPVVDGGKVIGVVTERDLFALQRVGIRSIHRTIADARDIGQLGQAAREIRDLASSLVAEGANSEPLTLIISALNDALTRRVIELEQDRHALDGIHWSWLAFGSEGRYEQTIATDQDNGILFLTRGAESADELRARLLPFARAVNRSLDACGYRLCKGDIMAGNPHWCLSLEEWWQRFEGWIADTDPQALLNGAIFFDFRLLYGPPEATDTLRRRLLDRSGATPRFLRQMAEQALAVRPPLGMLSDFVTEESADGHKVLDLKKSGARLFVDAARVKALAAGVAHTSTAERLRQGGNRLGVAREEIDSAVDAFFFLQLLRLRGQAAAAREGTEPDNRVRPDELNEVDRRTLKECLRQARSLQARLALDYGL